MEELVIDGRIADAGQFRPGSFEKLAAKMNERFPGWLSNKSLYSPGKPFRLYPCLEKIFSKERANGAAAICRNDAEEEKQGKKPYSPKTGKDTKMMKELTDTLKYVFDQHGKRLDAFAQAMVNTREEKRWIIS
ncbi:hypothetical protein PIB30_029261 [Stylosanthes scabra]|uniref:Uncharacterized protein n=1 Tax=Stylosanthes scabra TaxID=79078 RepID=A0ABU6UBG8_9FABA|nr:hypothetical protein [Stylosanthes scabra]